MHMITHWVKAEELTVDPEVTTKKTVFFLYWRHSNKKNLFIPGKISASILLLSYGTLTK